MNEPPDPLSDFLSDMVKEVKKTKKAQVLPIITATCSCGAVYTYPNRSRMVRRGGNIQAVRVWTKEYETFPKERMEISITIEVCQRCF